MAEKKSESLSVAVKRTLIEPGHPDLSLRRQCDLLGLNRTSYYYQAAPETPLNLKLMRVMDNKRLQHTCRERPIAQVSNILGYPAPEHQSTLGGWLMSSALQLFPEIMAFLRENGISIIWTVIASASASVAFETYEPLLILAAELLPTGCQVLFLADRGFGDHRLLRLLRDLNWRFRIRVKTSVKVARPGKPNTNVGRLMPPKGEVRFMHPE